MRSPTSMASFKAPARFSTLWTAFFRARRLFGKQRFRTDLAWKWRTYGRPSRSRAYRSPVNRTDDSSSRSRMRRISGCWARASAARRDQFFGRLAEGGYRAIVASGSPAAFASGQAFSRDRASRVNARGRKEARMIEGEPRCVVIANGIYVKLPKLDRAVSDAEDLAKALEFTHHYPTEVLANFERGALLDRDRQASWQGCVGRRVADRGLDWTRAVGADHTLRMLVRSGQDDVQAADGRRPR